jgi:hypothetical protein
MALFRRKPEQDPPISILLLQGHDMIEQTGAAHSSDWGLGSAERWDVDLSLGQIRWTFADHMAAAPVQVLGSHNATQGEWAWAWALDGVPSAVRSDVERVREFGHRTKAPALTSPRLPADESSAADLAAIAFRITEATGFYRGSGSSSTLFFTFGPVVVTSADGGERTFRMSIG